MKSVPFRSAGVPVAGSFTTASFTFLPFGWLRLRGRVKAEQTKSPSFWGGAPQLLNCGFAQDCQFSAAAEDGAACAPVAAAAIRTVKISFTPREGHTKAMAQLWHVAAAGVEVSQAGEGIRTPDPLFTGQVLSGLRTRK